MIILIVIYLFEFMDKELEENPLHQNAIRLAAEMSDEEEYEEDDDLLEDEEASEWLEDEEEEDEEE